MNHKNSVLSLSRAEIEKLGHEPLTDDDRFMLWSLTAYGTVTMVLLSFLFFRLI